MKIILLLVCVLLVLVQVEGLIIRSPNHQYFIPRYNMRHEGYCFSNETGPMYEGEIKQLKGQCRQVECLRSKAIRIYHCSPYAPIEGCFPSEMDFSKPHPHCCPQPECPLDYD